MTLKYPDDSIQSVLEHWWDKDDTYDFRRGRLIRTFIPHVGQVPYTIEAQGRSEPTDHKHAYVRIAPLDLKRTFKKPLLPVAAMPGFGNEFRLLYRAKKRPALIISEGGPQVEKTRGKPGWQFAPTVLVAPFYGADENEKRSGFPSEFVKRVRRCEYPQYFWDILPIAGSTVESIMRLDHIQPVGRHYKSIEITKYCLNEDAQLVMDEWFIWLAKGYLYEKSFLAEYKKEMSGL